MIQAEVEEYSGPQVISLSNLITYTLYDQGLRKNFENTLDNFKRIEARFNQFEQKIAQVGQLISSQNQKLTQSLGNELKVRERFQKEVAAGLSKFDYRLQENNFALEDAKLRIERLIDGDKKQQHVNDWTRKTFQDLNQQNIEVNKEIKKALDSVVKKAQKNDLQKIRRDVSNIQLKFETQIKRGKEVDQRIHKVQESNQVCNSFVLEIKEKVGDKFAVALKQIAEYVEHRLPGEQAKESKIFDINETAELQKRRTDETFVREGVSNQIYSRISDIQAKLAKIAERFPQKSEAQKEKEILEEENQFTFQRLSKVKLEGLEDKLTATQRKLDSFRYSVESVQVKIKALGVFRLQDKLRDLQVDQMIKLKEVNNKLQQKLESKAFQSHVQNMGAQFNKLNQILLQKAEKVHMKKAMAFLQGKIKQLVTVLSEQEQHVKDGLLSKKLLKCLSCDKELDEIEGGVINSQNKQKNVSQECLSMSQTRFLRHRWITSRRQTND